MVATDYDSSLEGQLIAKRRKTGADRYDEVWEDVYIMSPMPNIQHQHLITKLTSVLEIVFGANDAGIVLPGTNVSDRRENWEQNYRVPDVALYLSGTSAQEFDAFWYGGPDFAVEIISPNDRSREKLEFYGKVGTRELLLIDRDPWALELYCLTNQELVLADKSTLDDPVALSGDVLPLSWKLIPGEKRPQIEIAHSDGEQRWVV